MRRSLLSVWVATLPDLAMWRLTSRSADRPSVGAVDSGFLLLLAADASCISTAKDLCSGGDLGLLGGVDSKNIDVL